jgi:hypothetical protein
MGIKPLSKPGLPDSYTEEIGNEICQVVANCPDSFRKIRINNPHFPTLDTVNKWRLRYPEFNEAYIAAEMTRAQVYAEETLEIADDDTNDLIEDGKGGLSPNSAAVSRAKLKVETRKWMAAKLASKRYGDKISQEITGNNGGAIEVKSEHALLHEVISTLIDNSKSQG